MPQTITGQHYASVVSSEEFTMFFYTMEWFNISVHFNFLHVQILYAQIL